ncbi:MAG: DDE-type integrase/transposase/recombinase [Nitrospirales bacterium]
MGLACDSTAPSPNTKWVTDITHIPTQEGWLSLAVVLDVFSRQVIGGRGSSSSRGTWSFKRS